MTGTTKPEQDNRTSDGIAFTPGAHTSVIRSVTVRVAGPLTTEAFAHHFGTEEQQVGIRAGDTLTYVQSVEAAEVTARAFSDGVARAEREQLRHTVSSTWLGIEPGTYPPTLLQRHVAAPATAVGYQPRRMIGSAVVPAHVWVRVGPVLWQVCDRLAADRLAYVWSSCVRLLAGSTTPVRAAQPPAEGFAASARPVEGAPTRAEAVRQRPLSREDAAADTRTDADLLAGYVDGDGRALAVLVVRRSAWVAEAARRVLGSRGAVEDAVQDTWANVARTAHRFDGRAAVSTWLWRIAHNAAVSTLRAERPVVSTPRETVAPGDAYRYLEDTMVVQDLLAVLPAPQRAAVELVDVQGYDFAGAARLLGVPVGTVKSRCHRGRTTMAEEVARREVRDR